MSVPSLGSELARGIDATARGSLSISRVLFLATVLAGTAIFWIAPRLPLCDFAQHAGQVALLRDLLAHQSPWASIIRVNFFTPYLIGYGLTLLLSYLMPISIALKVVVTCAYLGFVACSMLLRRHFGSDERLDWLAVPSFFGFAFLWGFVTYLVAAPIGFLFILLADRYAAAPSRRRAAGLFALGIVLFFSHGLIFLFACAVGLLALRIRHERLSIVARHIGPYVLLGMLSVCYAIATYERDPLLALKSYLPHPIWGLPFARPFNFLRMPLVADQNILTEPLFAVFSLFMFLTPWLLGDRVNKLTRSAIAPFLVVVGVFLYVPSVAMKTAFLYERFALFVLPTYALMFRAAQPASSDVIVHRASRPTWRIPETAVMVTLAVCCWSVLGVQAVRMERFAAESAPFETILDAMEPGQRALSMVFQTNSEAFNNPWSYTHYPLWYQAERHGFVDMNFAWFLPQIARFRPGKTPAVRPSWEFTPETFNWKRDGGRNYRYFIVRDAMPLPAGFFANAECDVQLVRTAAEWSLYERKSCAGSNAGK